MQVAKEILWVAKDIRQIANKMFWLAENLEDKQVINKHHQQELDQQSIQLVMAKAVTGAKKATAENH